MSPGQTTQGLAPACVLLISVLTHASSRQTVIV